MNSYDSMSNMWRGLIVCTWDGLHSHSEEAFHLSFFTHDGHTMYQGHRVQQVTQVHKSPEEKDTVNLVSIMQ